MPSRPSRKYRTQKNRTAHKRRSWLLMLSLFFVCAGLVGPSVWREASRSWSSIQIDKSPVVRSARRKSGPTAVTQKHAHTGTRASQGLRCANPTAADMEAAIDAAGAYLVRVTNEQGDFTYREDLDPAKTPKRRYNLLRHAGTTYALARYYRWQPNQGAKDAALRSARYLKSMAIAPVPMRPDLLAVWSRQELTGVKAPVTAKLGGAGLALLALTSTNQIEPDETSLATLRKLANFICYMQKADGSFYSKYIPSQGGLTDRWTSLYYPGEAATGLMMLYEQDPDDKWLDAAVLAITYLADQRKGRTTVEADHWSLIATRRILDVQDSADRSIPRELLIAHAAQVCQSMLADRQSFRENHLLHGGFSSDGRTCPTATRLEGLIDASSFLTNDFQSLKQQIPGAIEEGVAFLLRAQVVTGDRVGGIPRSICKLPAAHPAASRSFQRRATELRIDYVQHAICAMIEFQHLRDSGQLARVASASVGE